jgi:predicted transcriptional regulator YdeE
MNSGFHRDYQTRVRLSDQRADGVNSTALMKVHFPNSLLIAASILAFGATILPAQDTMKPKPTQQDAFDVIGIQVRTNNAKEATGNGEIPKQWQRLFEEGILTQIPGKTDELITVVYSNYAGDWNGDYDYTLGAKVKAGTKAPQGMVSVTVPAGKFLEFESARGPGQTVVPEAWKQIWTYFQDSANPQRDYKADFERYEPSDPANVQAHIFMRVKP